MKTILEFHGFKELTTDESELKALAHEEAVTMLNAGDFLGAGEWYLSNLPYCRPEEIEWIWVRVITLWASSQEVVAPAENLQDLLGRVHEFASEDLALALVAVCTRVKSLGKSYPAKVNDLVFKLAEPLSKLFDVSSKLRLSDLLTASVAKHESHVHGLLAAVQNFDRIDCLGAKVAALDVLKHVRTLKGCVLPAERPLLGDLELLLGGAFRGFCAHCENRNSAEAAKAAPLLRDHVTHISSHGRRRQNSVFWKTLVEPVGKHIVELIEQESKASEELTTPSLRLASSVFKLDLSKVGKEMTFSCRLANNSLGVAKSVVCQPHLTSPDVEFRLMEPSPGFEVGGESEQVVTFAITLRQPSERLLVALSWTANTVRGKRYESGNQDVTIQQQRTQPDWNKLRLDPPYGTKAITRKERLYGRDAILRQLMVCASGGTSAFVWGAKRVGKTSVMQVLADELREIPGFVSVYLRVGEIGGYHEGKIAHTIAHRLCDRLGAANVLPPTEADFGASLAPLLPFAEKLVERFPDKKFIVIIDEFDDLDTAFYTGQRGKLFVKALRSLSEVGLTFFFVGSERMFVIYTKHAMDLNKWDSVYLDVITSREDCKALVLKPVENAVEYQPECVDVIVDYCGGNPFYMHLMCSEVFNRCSVEERTFVGDSDLHSVQQSRCRGLGETNFAHFWEDNPEFEDALKQQQAAENCLVLCCLSRKDGRCESQDQLYEVQEGLGLTPSERLSAAELKAVLVRLTNRKVLRKHTWKEYEIGLPIFRDWLSQNSELHLLPRWKKFCAGRAEAQPADEVQHAPIVEASFPISEDDLLLVSQNLMYCGKQKDAVEIRVWLRQFDDDVRIEIAFKLLRRLAEKGFVSEGSRRHLLSLLEEAIRAARLTIGQGTWKIVTGRLDNLCISFADSDSEIKSGAAVAREIAKSLRPGKLGPPDKIFDWMRTHKEQDPMVVLVDDFAGSGYTLSGGLKRFLENPDQQDVINLYLKEGRILCFVLCAFPEAQDRIRTNFPQVQFVAARVFGEELKALDPEAGIFENQDEINFTRDMLLQIGQELSPQNPLGMKSLGALLCFHNIVPNNTLPIFWSNGKVNEKSWKPLFPRA